MSSGLGHLLGRNPVATVVVLGFLARALYLTFHWDEVPVDDAYGFEQIALGMVHGEGFHRGEHVAFYMPAYVCFLAAHFRLFGHYIPVVQVTQLVLGSAVPAFVLGIGTLLFDRRVGFLAGILAALFFPFVRFVPLLLTENLFLPLLTLGILLFVRASRRERARDWLACGAGLGLLVLTRAQGTGILAALGIATVLSRSRGRLRALALQAVAFAVVFTPWVIRNGVLLGTFYPLSTQGSIYFGVENSGRIEDGLYHGDGDYFRVQHEMLAHTSHLGEVEQGRALRRQGWAYIAEHPLVFARWAALRMAVFWDVIPLGTFWPPTPLAHLRRWFMYAIFVLAGIGAFLRYRDRPEGVRSVLLVVICYTLPFVFFANHSYRLRTPIDSVLLILAAAGSLELAHRLRGHESLLRASEGAGGRTMGRPGEQFTETPRFSSVGKLREGLMVECLR